MKKINKINFRKIINKTFDQHISAVQETLVNIEANIKKSSDLIAKSLKLGGTIFWCGNGGSAADSQHIAAEFIGRFKNDRKPLRSIALTTDTSVITCVSNDYSFEEIFSRQLKALARRGDVLVVISTSGESENIKQVLLQAKKMGVKTIGLLGKNGGKCKKYVDIPLIVPSDITARIQEVHILIEHFICEIVEHILEID